MVSNIGASSLETIFTQNEPLPKFHSRSFGKGFFNSTFFKNMEAEIIFPLTQDQWRDWLIQNHLSRPSVWLGMYKTKTGRSELTYSQAVDQALCFGWIDSKVQRIDHQTYKQYYCKRKPNSIWSKVNKEKIERLTLNGQMHPSGLACIQRAQQNGSWYILDNAENLIIDPQLALALEAEPQAALYFHTLPHSYQRNLLQWLALAKRAETKTKRIETIIHHAILNQLPKNFNPPKPSLTSI